jgi:glucan phosphoethanolaminetransferase (alkaline phosphatase superfamily)
MNRKALIVGLAYSVLVIIFKLFVLLNGLSSTNFGFYFAHVISVVLIIPFYFIAIFWVRKKDFGGFISGKEGARVALTVLVVAIGLTSVYNYFEVKSDVFERDAKVYYNSSTYLNFLEQQAKNPKNKIKSDDFPRIIDEQINAVSPSKAVTGRLFTYMVLGLSGAFVAALVMKKKV